MRSVTNRTTARQAKRLAVAMLMLSLSASVPAAAADLPQAWMDEALEDVDEGLHRIIRDQMKSRLDWRSYYRDRTEVRRDPADPDFRSSNFLAPGIGQAAIVGA